jgi:hypothetical protein
MTELNSSPEFYSFEYSDGDARHISTSFTPGDTWPEVLEQFVSFMGNVYGYSIRESVAIKKSPFFIHNESWSGPVFNPEESL